LLLRSDLLTLSSLTQIAEVDPEKEDADGNMLVDLTFGLAKGTAMTV
jgi:hypothetical protein